MTVEKITVSIPSETLAKARKAVRSRKAPSLSAFIAGDLERLDPKLEIVVV